ncbi:MAG: methylglyoxal synthase [Spirochaetae bacterium HGW-Spirochaetae-7]|nr:MAG: methylglyoxal synthase [Spirochaetae bacterium HGW-Spirochaetae-7]
MQAKKIIALVAHDNRKIDLVGWVEYNWRSLLKHDLVCTGTTGKLVSETIERKRSTEGGAGAPESSIRLLKSGPLGGDQQLGALIAEGGVDAVIFFWDPMSPQPHDVDVKALLRIAVLYNIPMACNRSTADFLISSPLFDKPYVPLVKDYSAYIQRKL